MKLTPGSLYRISYQGRPCPNLYRYEGRTQPIHCQLHGEHIGTEHQFTKRRNSEVRPWSENHWFQIDRFEIEEAQQ